MANCPPCKKGAPAWMLTFGDMMSLLLTFFVLLLTMSQPIKVHFEKAAGSLRDAFGVQRIEQITTLPSGNTMVATEFQQEIAILNLKEKIELLVSRMVDNGDAEVAETDEGFLLRINDGAMFSPGTVTLRQEAKSNLQQVANLLAGMPNLIRVIGHTDNQPPQIGTSVPDNWALSSLYASAVASFFVTEGGVDARRLQVRGMGQYAPIADNDLAEGRVANRRVEILISRETLPVVTPSMENPVGAIEPAQSGQSGQSPGVGATGKNTKGLDKKLSW